MQIDFHHAVTYVVARLGGLSAADATIVAHASQYVDDATHDGPIRFATGERYVRASSAHKTLEFFDNADTNDNRQVWLPFHFLPGNQVPPKVAASKAFMHRIMCKPGSDVAFEMMRDCVRDQGTPFALHRLGVALHTFVDTWAHQQFVGTICDLNRVKDLHVHPDAAYKDHHVYDDLTGPAQHIEQYLASHMPLGHAGALTLPDLPFLKWRFKRANGEVVERDNPTDFLTAARAAFNVVRRYVAKDVSLPDAPLLAADELAIDQLLRTNLKIEGEDRHRVWLTAIADGRFSFGAEQVGYVDHGPGSWKTAALGDDPENDLDWEYEFSDAFLTSNWKRFHDAVHHHRAYVIHELLPQFGLCAT
ncbi:MAG: hypothetical protein RI907_1624 [Pseudomonadota bacterium]|jgi:hypothetical protein